MKEYKIASIAGDGIGKEVTPEGIKILKKVAEQHQFKIHFDEFDFASCDYHAKHGKMLPDNWKDQIGKARCYIFWRCWDARSVTRSHFFVGIFAAVQKRI
jgi:Isocitrate/isopropylmalate dehydrogenase